MTEADLPWLFYMCRKKYSSHYDPLSTENWFRNTVLKNVLLWLPQRLDHAFCISMLSVLPWRPNDFEATTVMTCADDGHHWEAMMLLRSSIAWAQQRKCVVWRFASDTDVDFEIFARRLGVTETSPRFAIWF